MSNQGVRGFYQITDTIKTELLKNIDVNTVTSGDLSQINLQKQDIFPLSHIMVNNVTDEENVLRFNISVLSMDIVDQSKEITTNIFTGNTNEQDILNTQLAVLNKLIQVLRKGDLHRTLYQLDGDPTLEPFYDRFENQLAGWNSTMDILIYNDITIC